MPQFDHCDLELLDDKLPGNHTNYRRQHGGNMSTGFGNQDKTLQEQSGYPTGQSKSQSAWNHDEMRAPNFFPHSARERSWVKRLMWVKQ